MNNKQYLDTLLVTGKLDINNEMFINFDEVYKTLSKSNIEVQELISYVIDCNSNTVSRFLEYLRDLVESCRDEGKLRNVYEVIKNILDTQVNYLYNKKNILDTIILLDNLSILEYGFNNKFCKCLDDEFKIHVPDKNVSYVRLDNQKVECAQTLTNDMIVKYQRYAGIVLYKNDKYKLCNDDNDMVDEVYKNRQNIRVIVTHRSVNTVLKSILRREERER